MPLDPRPEELLHFVETNEFAQDWENLGLSREVDLWDLENLVMAGPDLSSIIKGTGGLRKLRFSPAGWKRGKRGAIRVCYAYFPRHSLVLLVMAYAKGRKETMSTKERQGVREYLEGIERFLDRPRSK